MSNKPRIYGYCRAGCQWEAVHKEDFIKACSLVELNADKKDSKWYLEIEKQYKIFSENVVNVGYGFSITFKYNNNDTETAYNFVIPNDDKYANYVVFRLLEIAVDEYLSNLTIVYEIAGARYTETIAGTNLSLIKENYLYVENADAVYLYNEDASFSVEVETAKVSAMKTLSVEGWNSETKTQTVSMNVDIYKRNEIDIEPDSIEEWAGCGVYAISESETGITFKYTNKPTNALKFRVASSEVEYVSE